MTKTYQPLARKYRPGTFAELSGQDATTTALTNAIKLGREPHAVIFSGVRGIGKTTTARLYAKALNCIEGPTPTPCNQCESCLAISACNHEDVVEIDGASNTSVDNIRSLRDTINYVPQRSKFKVYIIDEVHMLSQSAFNALLKTLEEPPAHVVFVFATTELHKIPQTILSRCQVFFLQRFSLTAIRDRLVTILNLEKIEFEDKALTAVAREGHGSMRDALTLLDHVIAVGNGRVSFDAVSKIVSHITSTPFIELVEALVAKDSRSVIKLLDHFEQCGIDMDSVSERAAGFTRHAAIARDVGIEQLDFKSLGFDDEESRRLLEIGKKSRPFELQRIFRTLVKCSTELDGSALDRYILENYCLEWCLDPGIIPTFGSTSNTVVATAPLREPNAPARPPEVQQVSSVLPLLKSELLKSEVPKAEPKESLPNTEVDAKTKAPFFPNSWRELVDAWKRLKPLQARKLEEAHPIKYSAERIELVVPEGSYASASLLRPEEQRKLKDAFSELFLFKGALVLTSQLVVNGAESAVEKMPETLSSIHEREGVERRAKIEEETRSNSLTQEVLKMFNGQIEEIVIHDSNAPSA